MNNCCTQVLFPYFAAEGLVYVVELIDTDAMHRQRKTYREMFCV